MVRAGYRVDTSKAFRVGSWSVDPLSNELVRGGRRVRLEPRVMDLLAYLASRAGEVVSKEELVREVWNEAFVGDDALVSAVSALRRAFDDKPRHAAVLQTIPKRGYRLVAAVSGGRPAVAVLPLEDLSPDSTEEYFADGMTDALIAALGAHAADLRVISRTSSMCYKAPERSLPDIAARLGADFVVEGSVLRQEDDVRITVRLIDARADEHLWAEIYDRTIDDVLALQEGISSDVSRRIRERLNTRTSQEKAEPRPDAALAMRVERESYLEYLRGRFHLNRFTPEGLAAALRHFEASVAEDPRSPLPHIGIADVWGWHARWGVASTGDALPGFDTAVSKAMELAPEHPQTQVLVAKRSYYFRWDWDAADAAFLRALELNPNDAHTLWGHSLLLTTMAREKEAEEQARRAIELDPLSAHALAALGLQLLASGRAEDGLVVMQRACALEPGSPPARHLAWITQMVLGEESEAAEGAAAYFSAVGRTRLGKTLADESVADPAAAMERAARQLIRERDELYAQPTQIARLLVAAGSLEEAIEWLRIAVLERDTSLVHLGTPEWRPLEGVGEFRDIRARVGLPD